MFEIVFTICALLTPDFCETHFVSVPGANELQCQRQIMPEIAARVDPEKWRLKSAGCKRDMWL